MKKEYAYTKKAAKAKNLLNFGFGSLLVIIGVLFLPFFIMICLVFFGGVLSLGIKMTIDFEDFTKPVNYETLEYLCSELDLSETNRICQSETVIYANELEAVFEETLLKEHITYEAAQAILSIFQEGKADARTHVRESSEGRKYFMEQYDFVGDDQIFIEFYFDASDSQLFDISVYIPIFDD